MVAPQDTRKVVKMVKDAGFKKTRTVGSHSRWVHPDGRKVTVPDGHRTISPGVFRNILGVIKEKK